MIGFAIAFLIGTCFIIISSKIQSAYKLLSENGEKSEGIVFSSEEAKTASLICDIQLSGF